MSLLLHEIPNNPKFGQDVKKYIFELESRICTLGFFKATAAKSQLEPKESSQFFVDCIDAIEKAFAPDINSYSAMRWIYYLRRTPHAVFSGKLVSTGPSTRALAEIYAQRSLKIEQANPGKQGFVFPVEEGTLRHIARFVAFVLIVYDLQVGYRYANKGCCFRFPDRSLQGAWSIGRAPPSSFRPSGRALISALPTRCPDALIESAVRIYDERHNQQSTFLGFALQRAGLADNADRSGEVRSTTPVNQSIWGMRDESWFAPQELLKGHINAAMYGNDGCVVIRFGPHDLNLDALFEIHRLPSMSRISIDERASLCLLVLLLGGHLLQSRRYSFLRTMEVGYFVVDPEEWESIGKEQYDPIQHRVRQFLPQFVAPSTFLEFSAKCLELEGSAWPLVHGDPVRVSRDYVSIDMWAASMAFLAAYQFPKVQGQIANDRATKFEDVVQDLIDGTAWADKRLGADRQRTLYMDGKAVTDIDAIGSLDGVLLLISCKSIPYSLEYDRGSHNAIRNARSTLDEAVDYWAGIVDSFEARRHGDNYDFRGYLRIIGLVCTPFAVYTTHVKALSQTTPSLRWANSLDELARFLRQGVV
ncbi:hypothetical protein [uncultured Ramlibacter sp.]|uniref:hypothetical protein n=1 Tax=uncultured Ramlibacter sp. TaxID=260755 RepID=UPI00262CF722|nr:hypothetical protein [uncultured Ramlibacter sp.]